MHSPRVLLLVLLLAVLTACGTGTASTEMPLPTEPQPRYIEQTNRALGALDDHITHLLQQPDPADTPQAQLHALKETIDSLYAIEPPAAFRPSHRLLMQAGRDYSAGFELYRQGVRTDDLSLIRKGLSRFMQAERELDAYYLQLTLDYEGADSP